MALRYREVDPGEVPVNTRRPMQDAVEHLMNTERGWTWWSKREIARYLDWPYRRAESAVDKLAKRGVIVKARVPDPSTGADLWRLK